MKTFDNIAAQGDMMLVRITELPATAKPAQPENGVFILTHSETGHHHIVIERPSIKLFQDMLNADLSYLLVEDEPAILEHLRPTDTHEALEIKPGIYEVRRQREYSPSGWQRATD